MTLKNKAVENIVGKGENDYNCHFLFPQFSTLSEIKTIISITSILLSANAFNLEQSKILPFGNGLTTIVSFPHNDLMSSQDNFCNLSHKIVVYKCYWPGQVCNFVLTSTVSCFCHIHVLLPHYHTIILTH